MRRSSRRGTCNDASSSRLLAARSSHGRSRRARSSVRFPLIGFAQQAVRPLFDDAPPSLRSFRQGSPSKQASVEVQNVALDYRWADGQYDRRGGSPPISCVSKVAVIVTIGGLQSALAAKAATATITDRLRGWAPTRSEAASVTNLRRPGGNITGVERVICRDTEQAKRLELFCVSSAGPMPRRPRCCSTQQIYPLMLEIQVRDIRPAAAVSGKRSTS